MKRLFFIALLAICMVNAFAQTFKQRGVVRMITSSALTPTVPVKGVMVVVENNVSEATDDAGVFRVDVAKEFHVSGIVQDKYILALPTRGKTYFYSKNDLDVVVTTKAQREADYKKLYAQIKEKYDFQADEINSLRRQLQIRMSQLEETDAEFADTRAQFEALQEKYRQIVENEDNIDELIRQISNDLSITDYVSLDELSRRIFDLKRAGEWKTISDLLNDVMCGDAASYLQFAIDNKTKAEKARRKAEALEVAARHDLEERFRHMEDAIEAFMMQHLNDSVSRYYAILIKAAPDNWRYLNRAGRYEELYRGNYALSLDYHQKAIAVAPCDSLLAISYENVGRAYKQMGEMQKALENYELALHLGIATYGEDNADIATSYNNIGGVYYSLGDMDQAKEYLNKALVLRKKLLPENHPHIAVSYNNLGALQRKEGDYDAALKYFFLAAEIWTADKESADESQPNLATAYYNIGTVMVKLKNYAGALEYFQKTVELRTLLFGPDDKSLKSLKSLIEACKKKITP